MFIVSAAAEVHMRVGNNSSGQVFIDKEFILCLCILYQSVIVMMPV
jgi:hypothetical protein